MPWPGQPLDRRPAVLPRGRPQVEAGLGVVDPQTERLDRGQQRRPARGVARLLHDDVVGVGQGGEHGALHRPRHHHPGVLAHLEEAPDQGRVAGDERAAVAGQVRLLRQRVDAQQALVRAAGDPRVEDRGGRRRLARPGRARPPVELGVALVGGHHHPVLARPGHHLREVLDAEHLAGGVARSVEPQQLRRGRGRERTERGERVDGHRCRARPAAPRRRRSGRPPAGTRRRHRARAPAAGAARRRAPWSRSSAAPRRGRRRARRAGRRTRWRPPRAGRRCPRSAGSRGRRTPSAQAPRGPRPGWGRPACRPTGRPAPHRRRRGSGRKGTRPLLGRSERVPGEVGEPSTVTRRAPAAAGRR